MKMKRVFTALVVLSLSFCILTRTTDAASAELRTYLLVFQEDQDPEQVARHLQRKFDFELRGIYRYALKG
ncbi:MAG: hypothetical protein KKC18_13975, partial [Chloroflexi bacterium]|nr:hypothetical protein [Chloroflexota bacterium]